MASTRLSKPEHPARLRPWHSIRGKLGVLTIVLMGVIAGFILLFFPSQQRNQAQESAATTANTVADMISYALLDPMRLGDVELMNGVLTATMMLPDVVYVTVLDAEGATLVHRSRLPGKFDPAAAAAEPAGFADDQQLFRVRREMTEENDALVGVVSLGYSLANVESMTRSSRMLILYISLLVFVFGLAGVYAISYVITEPLGQMVRAAERVSGGDFSVRVKTGPHDEVGLLADTFNSMVGSLQMAYASLENANTTLANHSQDLQQEVAERARIEKALRQSEERFRAVVEHATDVVMIIGASGELQYVSAPCKHMLGYEASELVGTDFASLIHPGYRAKFRSAMSHAATMPDDATQSHVISLELQCRHRGGEWRYLALRGRNLRNTPGVEGMLFNVSDISELKRYQKQLVDARDTAEKMVKLKDSFLANMSHEIRTPLTGILGFAQVLRQEVGEEHLELVKYIQEGGTRLLNTLNSVLDLAQLEANALDMQIELVDLVDEVRDTVKLLEPLATVKNLTLRVKAPDDPVFAEVDKRCLYRIVNNLVTNAIKFTERGSVYATVGRGDGAAIIEVRDTGVGVSPDFLPHIFDEFKQESTGLSRSHEGSGLGLAITRRLVELHGGTVSATSTKGVGSTFTVRLPLAAVASAPLKPKPAVTPDRPPKSPSRSPRILLVEDNADTRLLFKRILTPEYDLTVATTPAEALQLGRMESFDIVLMDISLGEERDGVQVMKELRSTGRFDGVPFLAVTAYALPGDRLDFLSRGFQDYLAKPFRKEDLLDMVRRHLSASEVGIS